MLTGYLFSDGNPETREEDDNLRTCECKGATCMCCVDFNLTYIDLGGPGINNINLLIFNVVFKPL